jgi:outer membrane lipoprotein LolB
MRIAFNFIVLLLLAACSTIPERVPVSDRQVAWQQRQVALSDIYAWDMRGRAFVRAGEEAGQTALHWVRDRMTHRIDLILALGAGSMRLTQDERGAELRDRENRISRDSSLQLLLRRSTGWDLPLESLNYWVLGLPAPGEIVKNEIDEYGRLQLLEQKGWKVEYIEYSDFSGFDLPSRVHVKRNDGAAMEIRLAIQAWELSSGRR